jgi:two-component system sensor histidine kinase BaeS
MRRRLTIAILGTVLATLLVAGLGTLALANASARRQTEAELRDQAEATAAILNARRVPAEAERPLLVTAEQFNRVRNALEIDDIGLVVLTRDNSLGPELSDPLPEGLTVEDLRADRLRDGQIVSGSFGADQVFAVAPLNETRGALGAVVLTRSVRRTIGPAVGWFLLASGLTLAVAGLVSFRLAKQLTKPLRDATAATTRIANGDLAVRLPVEKHRRNDELSELSSSINQMAGTLQRSRGLEQQFLLSVSHDLRTPLTSIRGYAEALADGTATDAQAASAVILTEARRLERLVGDLLDLARLESRQFTLHETPLDLAGLVQRGVAAFEQEAHVADVELDLVVPDHPIAVRADPDRLAQVLANLLENALKYASHRIEIAVHDGGTEPRLEVADDGDGIAAEDLPHVFERLYVAASKPVRRESGSGLGLAIARELTDAMGGRVIARPNEPQGTRFVVTLLPVAPDVRPANSPPGSVRPF